MKKWEMFENEIAEWVGNEIQNKNIVVEQLGTSDSTQSDIRVSNGEKEFFIETKMPKAQTSQFALTVNDDKFAFSDGNRYKNNQYSKAIIKELNSNSDYLNAGTKGIEIAINSKLASNWIKSNMKNKGVKFVATKGTDGLKKIIKLKDFGKEFEITAKLRRKKSGSRPLPKKDYKDFITELSGLFSDYEIVNEDKNLLIKLNTELQEVHLENTDVYLIKRDNGLFEPRKLSTTFSNTVIFEIKSKTDSAGEDLGAVLAF